MRILSLNSEPIHEIRCLNAGRRPGAFTDARVPVLTGTIAGLPDGMDALVITSDLRARETFQDAGDQPLRLLGGVLPDQPADDWLPDWGFPPAERTGIILAGDLWTEPALDAR